MQDDREETINNMQAENENVPSQLPDAKQLEPLILPGPSLINWRKVAPNSVTLLATLVGLSAVYLALENRFQLAVLSILLAGVLDGLDGPIARALSGTSRFGAELDSLSDYVNFGVSPALVLYFWIFKSYGYYGWLISMVYTLCMGCRLARFNAGVDFNASKVTRSFFMGVPAPAGAMLVLFPVGCFFEFGETRFTSISFCVPYTLFVSYLLVSKLPTFSSKMINKELFGKLTIAKIVLCSLVAAAAVGIAIQKPWLSMTVICAGYVCSFPVSYAT
eukprot:CAMPEP_0168543790 /NCGR_PEP_ID=MMETSP0413-20121227/2081_1 /TAXON_ID=136452 /ORGANISM="Filamoeba nolandi, Strain NC-AS-23-1" /LENGTH=275 /DNA_ID=CAMNT_0008573781 /DNA_START=11 /DNA_END=835 /DNA_ORIENTATION=+